MMICARESFFALRGLGQLVIGVDPGLLLGLARPRALAHPLEFAFERPLLGLVFARFLFEPLGLLFEPGRIVALVGNAAAAVQLEDPAGDVVEEIAVVGDDQAGALVVDQVLLEPSDGLRVEVVRGLVQKQHVGRFEQELAERHAALLTARERLDVSVVGRAAQRLHRHVDLRVKVPEVGAVDLVLKRCHLFGGLVGIVHRQFVEPVELGLLVGHGEHDVVAHVQAFVQLGLLRQVAHARAFGRPGLAGVILVDPGHDPHQRRLTGAVDADDTDLDAGQEAEADVFKAFLAAGVGLGNPVHVVDELVLGHRTLRALTPAF